mmetsp:Transcript_44462/g.87229  ORF Transcript_44462/g.87229 Transcript_44462/m.87229 type:complete len:84 (-) Transcript_44462:877-1128(-)|eukprot:CAMPEP_0194314946 /NCGR_PEP_ID=MMETSP0171-20130528/11750_1 /TAXON_ID=218684 /ORGANISM="Corethron pennatum, Strain L29A3" /LENGTH=83 /DNA_ID=CAMNT_0039070555 /DNA_START=1565 /DNA_END=1816 /DNA_ORIENTATION=+
MRDTEKKGCGACDAGAEGRNIEGFGGCGAVQEGRNIDGCDLGFEDAIMENIVDRGKEKFGDVEDSGGGASEDVECARAPFVCW